MTLQSSGAISLQDIAAEFGGSAPYALSQYYRGGGRVPVHAGTASIPSSGQISMDQFYGTRFPSPSAIVMPVPWNVTRTSSGGFYTRLSLSTSSGNAGKSFIGDSIISVDTEIEQWSSPLGTGVTGVEVMLTPISGTFSVTNAFLNAWFLLSSAPGSVAMQNGSPSNVATVVSVGTLAFRSAASGVILGSTTLTLTHNP